jgi:hypothetical protein
VNIVVCFHDVSHKVRITRSETLNYAACSGNSLPKFRDNLQVSSSRVKNLRRKPVTLIRGLYREGCGRSYQYRHTLHNSPEERSSHLLLGGNLKSLDYRLF